jgi:hypothetical protein
LIRVDEPLFLPLERRLLAPQALEFPLRIGHVSTFSRLLVADMPQDQVGLLEQLADGCPHDRLDVGLTDTAQVAAPRWGFDRSTLGTFIAATGPPCMAA